MPASVRAELVKLTTTRTAAGLVLGATAVALLATFSTSVSGEAAALSVGLREQTFFVLASIYVTLFALVLGIRAFTEEFRHGVIVPTLLVDPRRRRVLAAKVLTYAVAGMVLAVVAQAAMVGLAIPLLESRGADLELGAADAAAVAGLVAASALWATIGVAAGALVRHQVAAVVGALVWVLVVENLGTALLGDAGRYLPGQAGRALARAAGGDLLMGAAAGALVLVAYALVITFVAMARVSRTDISPA